MPTDALAYLSRGQRIQRQIMRRVRPWFFLSLVYVRDIRNDPDEPPPPGYHGRIVSREELLAHCDDPDLKLTPHAINRGFDHGDVCAGLFHENRLVAYLWRSTNMTPHNERVWVQTRKPYRYGYKAWTVPAYRGRHLQKYVGPISKELFIERGFNQSIGFIETHNFASRRSDERRGSVAIGYAGFFTLFGRIVPFHSPAVKRTGFRFFEHKD